MRDGSFALKIRHISTSRYFAAVLFSLGRPFDHHQHRDGDSYGYGYGDGYGYSYGCGGGYRRGD